MSLSIAVVALISLWHLRLLVYSFDILEVSTDNVAS